MATHNDPEIILYDLACTKNTCFSPFVWRIRLILNYKRIPYTTIFLEFPDIEPTLKSIGIVASESSEEPKYTVPVIRHVPKNTYMMGSVPIARFLETTYSDPAVLPVSDWGREIEAKVQDVVDKAFHVSITPREMGILSPRAQEYFRRTREPSVGHRLEDLLGEEEEAWSEFGDSMRAAGEMMLTHKADGPFVLGARPSGTDFFIVGWLQSAREIDEAVFQRIIQFPGYKEIYEACQPYMKKKD